MKLVSVLATLIFSAVAVSAAAIPDANANPTPAADPAAEPILSGGENWSPMNPFLPLNEWITAPSAVITRFSYRPGDVAW
jgi:hypothetical protein